MGLIELLLVLVVVGFVCWLVLKYIPMASPFKEVFLFVVVLVLIVFVLQSVGLLHTNLRLS